MRLNLNLSRLHRQFTGGVDVLLRYLATPFAQPNDSPVIVLGNSKAGTTVIAGLLAEHAGLSCTLDFWPRLRRPETLERVHAGEMPFDAFVHRFRADFARDVVKDPHLTFLYPQLAQRFPRASFVMVVRDPRDNIRSILDRLDLPGDAEEIDAAAYRRMRPLWRAILRSPWLDVGAGNYVERLAGRWLRGAEVYLRNRAAIELIRYEDFLADKAGAIAGLADRLGLERRGRIANKLDRRYQPRGNRGVSWEDFFGRRNLRAIERICRPGATELGYSN